MEGQERAGTNEPPYCQKPGCPGLAVTPGALESWISVGLVPGAKGTSPASIFFPSLTGLDSASCQSRGACYPLPTLPVPELHAHQPHPPEDKGLHCLHSPSLAPYLPWPVWLPEEGRTRFLLLVLTPL